MIVIDKDMIYECHGYKFKNFVVLTDDERQMVLEWRNSPEVRKWMLNKEEISYENHCKFIDSLTIENDKYYWLVYAPDQKPIGVFDIIKVDRNENKAESGDYAKPKKFGDGFYFLRECLYFYFNILEIEKTYVEADINNKNIHILNTFFGIKYNGRISVDNNGSKREFLICDNFTREIFNERYKLTFRDFLMFFRQYDND